MMFNVKFSPKEAPKRPPGRLQEAQKAQGATKGPQEAWDDTPKPPKMNLSIRNIKRKCFMHINRLQARAVNAYISKPKLYTLETGITAEHVAIKQKANMKELVPKRWWPRTEFNSTAMPAAYPLHKGKCLSFGTNC